MSFLAENKAIYLLI